MFKKIASLTFLVLAISCTKEQPFSDRSANVSFEEINHGTKVTVSDNKLAWEQTDSYYLYNGAKGYKYQYVSNGVFRPAEAVKKSDMARQEYL